MVVEVQVVGVEVLDRSNDDGGRGGGEEGGASGLGARWRGGGGG